MRNAAIKCMLIFALSVSGISLARDISHDEALKLRQQGQILALEQIIAVIKQQYPDAKLLEAELDFDDGIYQYEVEILTREGVVRDLDIDSKNANILKDEED